MSGSLRCSSATFLYTRCLGRTFALNLSIILATMGFTTPSDNGLVIGLCLLSKILVRPLGPSISATMISAELKPLGVAITLSVLDPSKGSHASLPSLSMADNLVSGTKSFERLAPALMWISIILLAFLSASTVCPLKCKSSSYPNSLLSR